MSEKTADFLFPASLNFSSDDKSSLTHRPQYKHLLWNFVATFVPIFTFAFLSISVYAETQEPAAPKACAILNARLASSAVEATRSTFDLDTHRIQDALSLCSPGKAVVLTKDRVKNAFLSAPLVLPRGVTLFIEDGVTLYASRNPRDYDLKPSSCGVLSKESTVGCKPFLFAYQATYSGVMGAGTIDGQGGRPLLGSQRSWWSLAAEARKTGQKVSVPDLVSSYESQGFRLMGIMLRNASGIHASLFKTIGSVTSQVKMDSPADSEASAGLLLSNSPDTTITDTWIRVPSEAIAVKASILGGTSRVTIRDVHIFGSKGIVVGDDVYGSVKELKVLHTSIEGAKVGFVFNRKGSQGSSPRDIQYDDVCMRNVSEPLRVEQPDGSVTTTLSAEDHIEFQNVIVAGRGRIAKNGLELVSSAICENFPGFSAAPKFSLVPDRGALPSPGNQRWLIVAPDGSGDFTSVQKAVDALPVTGGDITIKPGTYREVVTVRKPHVHLHGNDTAPAETVIVFDNGAPTSGGTFNSASVFVEADDVFIEGLTIANDFGVGKGQAVALAVIGDRAIFKKVRLLGAQDTLFAASKHCYSDYGPCIPARQYFYDCYIEGNVDFIFGDSQAFFDHCELHGISSGNVMYTAQSKHSADQPSGYVFYHCHLTAESRTNGVISLGRPWRPHATVVYLHAVIDAPVIPEGWTEWPRFGVPSLPIAFYAEFDSSGPDANPEKRESYSHQLTEKEAEHWSIKNFLAGEDGWQPEGQR